MGKNLFSIFCAGLFCISAFAQQNYVPSVIKIYDEAEIVDLLDNGVEISRRRGDILLCLVPSDGDDDIIITNSFDPDDSSGNKNKLYTQRSGVHKMPVRNPGKFPGARRKKMASDFLNTHTLDHAMAFYNASSVQDATAFGEAYRGKGVVVGICDIGLDPLHPTFYDADGNNRIKKITHYKEFEGLRYEMTEEGQYSLWKTDTDDEYHATHVAGIMAGGGAGTSFKGVATDADIVISLSSLTSYGLLMGVEDIIDYAKEVGKPAVINLSMGNYIGAHDGSSLFSQYIDMCAEDAFIVLSAGNEGNNTNSLVKKFTDDSKEIQVRLGNRRWDQRDMYGVTDIWSSTENPVTLTVCIYDDESHTIAYEYPPMRLMDGENDSVTFLWDPEDPLLEGLSLDGFMRVVGGVDPENGRYNVALLYDYKSSRLIGQGWAKDMISIRIEGESGEDVEIFADGTYTRLMTMIGFPAPDTKLSISDLACGFKMVSVGMYGNRETYPYTVFDEKHEFVIQNEKETGYEEGGTVIYSSYGTLRDGRVLPLTVAPGIPLVSAFSAPYAEKYFSEEEFLLRNGSYWISMGGTSMSSPYVAGFIACMIEAYPQFTVEELLDAIASTNSHDIADPEDPRNLNGYFDPVACLRKLLQSNGVNQIEKPDFLLQPDDFVEVFSLSGNKVFSGEARNIDNLPKGIYIIKTPFGVIKRCCKELAH